VTVLLCLFSFVCLDRYLWGLPAIASLEIGHYDHRKANDRPWRPIQGGGLDWHIYPEKCAFSRFTPSHRYHKARRGLGRRGVTESCATREWHSPVMEHPHLRRPIHAHVQWPPSPADGRRSAHW